MIEKLKGHVFNIEKYHLNDGPGIRTIVFLKRCPCYCPWCSNPESFSILPVIAYHIDKCKQCKTCIDNCPKNAIYFDNNSNIKIKRELCNICRICVDNCVNNAFEIMGKEMYLEEVIKEIEKDASFYRRSGGGITLSGGEPCIQPNFSRNILKYCKFILLISTAVETSGCCSWDDLWETVEYADEVLFDIKQTDSVLFKKYICSLVDLKIVKNNLFKLRSLNKNVIIRYPLIPGYTNDKKNINIIIKWAKEADIKRIDILPFHQYGKNKYKTLDLKYRLKNSKKIENDEIEEFKKTILDNELDCFVGG